MKHFMGETLEEITVIIVLHQCSWVTRVYLIMLLQSQVNNVVQSNLLRRSQTWVDQQLMCIVDLPNDMALQWNYKICLNISNIS